MHRYFCYVILLVVALWSLPTRSEIVYKNTEGTGWIDDSGGQRGQTVILAGTQRQLSKFTLPYISRLEPSSNVTAQIRFYANTNYWTTETGGPHHLIYDSGQIPLPPQSIETESNLTLDLSSLNIRVEDYFTWSIAFSGVREGERVGLKVLDQAEIGRNAELGPGVGILWGFDSVLEWMQGYILGYYAVTIEAEGGVLPPVEEPPPDPSRPANDDFRYAVLLQSAGQTNIANLVDATLEPGEPYTGTNFVRSVWYSWRSTVDGELQAHISPTGGVILDVFQGSTVSNLKRVPFGTPHYLIRSNVNYYLRIASLPSIEAGTLSHVFRETPNNPAGPPNDDFANSIRLEGTNPWQIASLHDATIESGEPRQFQESVGKTIWYSWVAPYTGRALVLTSSTNILASVYQGSSLTNLQRFPPGLLVTAGELYYIQFDQLSGTEEFNFSVYTEQDTPPMNDNFADAEMFAGNSWYQSVFFTHATREELEPAHRSDGFKSLWWSWQAPFSARGIVMVNSDFMTNAGIAVYSGDALDRLSLLTSGEDVLAYKVEGGKIYKIAVSVPEDASGNLEFRVYSQSEGYDDPIHGNLVRNSSFEEGENRLEHWNASLPTEHIETRQGPAAHGAGWLVLPGAGTRISQEITTLQGGRYEVAFTAKRTLATSEPIEVNLKWNGEVVSTIRFPQHQGMNWVRQTTVVTATNEVSRIEVENPAIQVDLDSVTAVWAEEPPSITKEPFSLSSPDGGNATFSLAANGTEPLKYQWYYNDSPILAANRKVLILTNVLPLSSGAYYAVVSNDFGAVTSRVATLQVDTYTAPTILVQPSGFVARAGTYNGLSVLAAGTGLLRYQWYRDGTELVRETNSSLVFPSLSLSDSGKYEVKVTGSDGSVLSLPASVNVMEIADPSNALFIDAPGYEGVYDADSITGVGSTFVSQVFIGATELSLKPVSIPLPFRDDDTMGAVNGPFDITVNGISVGEPAFAQLRVWEVAKGATFEHARAAGGKFGVSQVVPIKYERGVAEFETPTFSVKAGLPSFTTGKLQPVEILTDGNMRWSFEGLSGFRYLIEKSGSDFFWQPSFVLTNETGKISFITDVKAEGEFYRSRILD